MSERQGSLMIVVTLLLFGIGGVCIKMVPWSGFAINALRCLISSAILFTFLHLTKGKLKITKGSLLGAVFVCLTTTLYSVANTLTTAGNAILLQFVAPIFVILAMWVFFHQRPKRLDVITCFFVLLGVFFFVVDGLATGNMLGNMLALISGVTYAGIFMIGTIPGGDSFSSAIIGQFVAGIICLPFVFRETDFSLIPMTFVIILGVFQLGLAYIFFCIGVKYTPPIMVSLLAGIEPLVSVILAAIFIGEKLSVSAAIGGVLVLGSVTIYNILSGKKKETGTSAK